MIKKDKPRAVELGKTMAKSAHGYERFFAYTLLGAVCNPLESREESMGADIAKVLSAATDEETNSALLQSLAYALGHAGISAMPAIYKLCFHADADVRYAATTSYGSALDVDGENLEPRYIKRIIELTRDTDPDVRNWATFTIGQQTPLANIKTDEILQALIARTRDRHFDTRSEAYIGLANRGDTSQIVQFKTWLASQADAGPIGKLNVEAAGKFGSLALYESLLKIEEWWSIDDPLLQWAIARCSPDAFVRAKTPADYDPFAERFGWYLDTDGKTVRHPQGKQAIVNLSTHCKLVSMLTNGAELLLVFEVYKDSDKYFFEKGERVLLLIEGVKIDTDLPLFTYPTNFERLSDIAPDILTIHLAEDIYNVHGSDMHLKMLPG